MSIQTLLALAVLGKASACVTAHLYMQNCIFGGDTLVVQVFDNGVQVCDVGSNSYFASDATSYSWDDQHGCSPGWSVSATHNGKSVSIVAANGYAATLQNTDTHDNTFVCGNAFEHDVKGSEFESCFSDNNGDCAGQAGCQLCDFKAYC